MKQASTSRETAESPARNSYAVTPHDTNEIGDYEPKAIYVGTGGALKVKLIGDTEFVTLSNVQSGSFLPIRPRIISNTDTTASAIIAFY